MGVVIHPPLQFYAGDTWELVWNCNDVDGNPLDLTNALSIEWKLDTLPVRQNVRTDELGGNISVIQPATGGQCVLTLPPTVTTTITPGYYFDQLRVTTATGFVSVQASGRVQCLPPL